MCQGCWYHTPLCGKASIFLVSYVLQVQDLQHSRRGMTVLYMHLSFKTLCMAQARMSQSVEVLRWIDLEKLVSGSLVQPSHVTAWSCSC